MLPINQLIKYGITLKYRCSYQYSASQPYRINKQPCNTQPLHFRAMSWYFLVISLHIHTTLCFCHRHISRASNKYKRFSTSIKLALFPFRYFTYVSVLTPQLSITDTEPSLFRYTMFDTSSVSWSSILLKLLTYLFFVF